ARPPPCGGRAPATRSGAEHGRWCSHAGCCRTARSTGSWWRSSRLWRIWRTAEGNAMDDVVGCLACDLTNGRQSAPGGRLEETAHWVVEHCVGPLGVGTLIVKPLRHVEHVAELSAE